MQPHRTLTRPAVPGGPGVHSVRYTMISSATPWSVGSAPRTCLAKASTERRELMVQRARQLYEDAWSQGKVLLLESIMAEEHAQVDRVWQAAAGIGRRRMKRGILAYRAAYPDIKFSVEAVAPVDGKDMVFVYWEATGTNLGNIREQPPTGRRVEFAGVSLLSFNAEGQIQQSMVFRQAPEDEKAYFVNNPTQ